MKNTFIHFDEPWLLAAAQRSSTRSRSCPTLPSQLHGGPHALDIPTKAHSDGDKDVTSEDTTSCGDSQASDDYGDTMTVVRSYGDNTADVSACTSAGTSSAQSYLPDTYEERCKAIGCQGCGCQFPVVCEHARANKCNKAKCRYCHCPFMARAGTGSPAAKKQRTKTYIERMHSGDLTGNQYLTLMAHLFNGADSFMQTPEWLQDPAELQSIATALVHAFAHKCKPSLARETVLRILSWMQEAWPSYLRKTAFACIVAQLKEMVAEVPLQGAGSQVEPELKSFRAEVSKSTEGKEVMAHHWPKKSEENGLSSAPWLGVIMSLIKSFAWEIYFHNPNTPIFSMDNIFGQIARDVRDAILNKLQTINKAQSSTPALPSMPRQGNKRTRRQAQGGATQGADHASSSTLAHIRAQVRPTQQPGSMHTTAPRLGTGVSYPCHGQR